MKKRIGLIGLLLVAVMLFMCACSGAQDTDTAATGNEKGTEQQQQEQAQKPNASTDDLTKGNRIVVCQNAELKMEDVTVSDVKATAASVQELVDKYFNNKVTGDVNIVGTDGYQVTMSAKDFLAAKISLDAEGIAPVIWNEDLGGKGKVKTPITLLQLKVKQSFSLRKQSPARHCWTNWVCRKMRLPIDLWRQMISIWNAMLKK